MKEPSPALIGREHERGEIERLIRNALRGDGGCLVVRGEPGIGKTALLGHAVQAAGAAVTVLRAAGVDAESDLAFAGLYDLLRPVLGKLDQLTGPQRQALEGALGLAPSPRPDRLFVSAAVLGLVAAAAEDHPVLCLIDDAQWIDGPSAGALVFTARRLRAERVAMLFAARDGEQRQFRAQGLPELHLGGLPAPAAGQVLDRAAPGITPAVRERLLADAGGNPLALLELPGELTAAQLGGRASLPSAIPLTSRLQRIFGDRIEALPAPTRLALLLAAADNAGDVKAVLGAAHLLKLPADALDPAESADLIRAAGGVLTFRHPLVRSVLYEGAPLGQRQRAHAALAEALRGHRDADRRIWHQAMAANTGDEQVAAALETSAWRSQQRAGHASAATAFERAATLTLDESRLVPRLAAAAQAAWDAGQAERARALIARASPLAAAYDRARLLHLRGVIETSCGSMARAVTTQLEAADASDNPSLTLEILHQAAEGAADTRDLARLGDIAARVSRTPARTTRDQLSRSVALGIAALFSGDPSGASTAFTEALTMSAEFDNDPRAQLWAVNAAWLDTDIEAGLRFAARAADLTRAQGLLSLLPAALNQQAREQLRTSLFTQAYATAEEGYLLSADLGHGWGWHLNTMTHVEAVWGREADARQHARQVLEHAQARGDILLTMAARAATGLLALTIGRPDEAARILLEVSARDWPDMPTSIAAVSVPDADAIEAILRAGQPRELADAPLARIRGWAESFPVAARKSVLARCEALLGARPPDAAFTEAVELGRGLAPFERARTELLYGEWLRRERKRTQARDHLRAAADMFHELGTSPWAQRAEAELRATGETARKRTRPDLSQLTPQELKIAALVAEGLTNREIAAQLFLSPRTIDYHLHKVFGKLGITSRAELIVRAASQHDRD
jgi:DNA-binding CsgD family transcriptional regulator